jgi:hypothetical protein
LVGKARLENFTYGGNALFLAGFYSEIYCQDTQINADLFTFCNCATISNSAAIGNSQNAEEARKLKSL